MLILYTYPKLALWKYRILKPWRPGNESQRDGSGVKGIYCSYKEQEFSFQSPIWVALALWLQLHTRHPLLAFWGIYTHVLWSILTNWQSSKAGVWPWPFLSHSSPFSPPLSFPNYFDGISETRAALFWPQQSVWFHLILPGLSCWPVIIISPKCLWSLEHTS